MAALSVASRRLPGTTQRDVCPSRLFRAAGIRRAIELAGLGTFPGAACCQPIELPSYKAAPLQALGTNTPRQRATPFEDEDDYESESLLYQPGPKIDRERQYDRVE